MTAVGALGGVFAILRGVTPEEVLDVAQGLHDGGIGIVEVPLNSPRPFQSLERLAHAFGDRLLVGAGTVLRVDEVDRVADAGARLVVSPNLDPAVVERTRARGLLAVPGVATPTEAFVALAAGAHALKLFPAEMLGPPVVKAWRAVLPPGTRMLPGGGVGEATLAAFKAAGAAGAGIGTALCTPGIAVAELGRRARRLRQCWDAS